MRASRHHPLAANPHAVEYFDRVRVTVRSAEREEQPDPALRVTPRLPEELIEAVVHGPGAILLVRGLDRDEQLREESLQDPREDRAGIAEPGEPLSQEALAMLDGS